MENNAWDEHFKNEAVKVMDEVLVKACHVKLAHPEVLGDVLLGLAQHYEKNANRDEII